MIARDHHRRGPVALHAHVAHATSWKPKPLRSSSSWKSCHAAVPTLRDDADAQRDRAQRRRLLASSEPVGGQPAQHLVALLGEVAEREARVEVGHLQPELPAGRVEVEVAEDAHLHAVGEPQAVLLQHRPQPHRGRWRRTATRSTAFVPDVSSASVK